MSNIEILMPALSPTMEEGGIAKWLVKPGDTIRAGDLIAEIETDKAIMEFESASDGMISELLVEEGSNQIKVNTPIALISDESISTKGRKECSPHCRYYNFDHYVKASYADKGTQLFKK